MVQVNILAQMLFNARESFSEVHRTHGISVWDVTWMSDQCVHLAKWMAALEQVTVTIYHLGSGAYTSGNRLLPGQVLTLTVHVYRVLCSA